MARFPTETLSKRKHSNCLECIQQIPRPLCCRESGPTTPFPISNICGAFFASHARHRNLVLGNRGSDDSSKKILCLTAWYSKLISKLMLLRSLERQRRKAGYTSEKCLISYHSQGSLRSWASSAASLPGFRTFYSCKRKQMLRASIL